jgi:multisubunit Na+/H+ antiporter MnhC subunit
VGVEWGAILHYGLPTVLSLLGFHGLFFHGNLLKKIFSWALFQTGLLLFLLFLPGALFSNPLPNSLLISLSLASLGILLALLSFCLALRRKFGTLESDEIAKRMVE